MRHKQNPASGKHIRSQGSFYYDVKMIKRGFCFHFVGSVVAARQKCKAFFRYTPRGYNRGEGALKAKS